MALGLVVGLSLKFMPLSEHTLNLIVDDILKSGGAIFITVLKMLVVPVVFVSLVCGSASIDVRKIGRVGGKTVLLYVLTTAVAITLALIFASLFNVGQGLHLQTTASFNAAAVPTFKQILLDLFPSNPFRALVEGNMLQVIIFSLIFGIAISHSGKAGERLLSVFQDANQVIINLVLLVMKVAPYGVFCLIAALFAELGISLILDLLGYFATVIFVLFFQLFVSYSLLLKFVARLNPVQFFKKMYQAMLFAFSVSSSNASIPIVLETVEDKIGVKNSIASLVFILFSWIVEAVGPPCSNASLRWSLCFA